MSDYISNEEYAKSQHQKIVTTAKDMLERKTNFIFGVRILVTGS
jgi:hypothetical protein